MIELELGEEILRQIEETSGKELRDGCIPKFDAKGTLHVLKRDEDGKLLDDIPIKEVTINKDYVQETARNYTADIEVMHKQNMRINIISTIIMIFMALCFIGTLIIIFMIK